MNKYILYVEHHQDAEDNEAPYCGYEPIDADSPIDAFRQALLRGKNNYTARVILYELPPMAAIDIPCTNPDGEI